jgi:hypothetical protein
MASGWLNDTSLGLPGVIMESNVGGLIPLDRVLTSIHLYAEEVAPDPFADIDGRAKSRLGSRW